MVSFLHIANRIDDWLIEAAEIVLPALHPIYCQVLRTADPSRVAKGTRTNLTPLVKQNRTALSALGSILEYVINFCDVDTEQVAKHLKKFILSSTAVLLASDIQSPKDIVCINPSMYAVDDTLRKASWALSNILLTFPRLVPVAETIIMKRIDSFFKLLQDPYELTVQRSAIVALKALSEHGSATTNRSEASTRDVIDGKIKSVFHACPECHLAFQRMRLNDNMFKDVNRILNRFYSEIDINERGVTTNDCSVQVKCLEEKTRRRVPFRVASVDWNLNSMMVRYEDESTIHWPFFAVQNFEWRRKNQDLWMKFEGWESRKATDVVIRFKTKTVDVFTKSSIEQRIRRVMRTAESNLGYDTEENVPNSEDSDIVEAQNVRTTGKKCGVPRERCESDDRNVQEENLDECHSAHVNEIQRGDRESNAAEGQNADEVLPGVTADDQTEVVWTDLFTSGQTCQQLTDKDNPSKDFSKEKVLGDTKHGGGQDALSKIESASDAATANREDSDINLSDAEPEDYARIEEGIEKSGESQERKSKVKFASNPDEVEVIIISDDDRMEPMDPADVEVDVEGGGIKEEDIAENMQSDQKDLEPQIMLNADTRTRVNFRNQSRFRNRMGKNDQHAEQSAQRCDKSGRNKPPDGIISDDDFMEEKDCSDESSEYEDSSDNDYIPGDVELMVDEDFEKADHVAVQTRRQLREQTMPQNENKHTRTGIRKNKEWRHIERGLDHGQRGLNKSHEDIRKCFTEHADGEFCENVEVGRSDDNVKSSELNSNLVDGDDEFENGQLDELGIVEEKKIDAVTEGNGESRAHEGYVCGADSVVETLDKTHERHGDDSGSVGEDVENSPNMNATEELGEVAEDANCRKDVDKRDRNCNGSNKCSDDAAVIINYREVKDQFGSLVENLNEVSWIVQISLDEKILTTLCNQSPNFVVTDVYL